MIYLADSDFTLHLGDVLEVLREMPSESVDCVITSPPYWGLRDYSATGQLGLEPTPEQYVERMTEVFREVRRVLAAHGTCWVNMGDSYASGPGGNLGATSTFASPKGSRERSEAQIAVNGGGRAPIAPGLKPKDLCGIPWRLAFALQQPYWNGRIKEERDRLWLAAMIDTEGSIGINFQRGGEHRPRDVYSVSVKVHNTSERLVQRCAELAGVGSVALAENRGRPVFVWSVYGVTARELLREVYPHLVAKPHEARLAYAHGEGVGDGAQDRYRALRLLHAGKPTTLDAPAPPSCLEPGWYLRSDIVWSKPNPMPESVTDRPTKAHEYVFLLTKSPRYFFDQEAVREAWREASIERMRTGLNARTVDDGFVASHALNRDGAYTGSTAGRNIRSVWEIATQPYPEAHFATFPEELVRRCLLAGCPAEVCAECGKARERVVERESSFATAQREGHPGRYGDTATKSAKGYGMPSIQTSTQTTGFTDCGHDAYRPGVCLDPFMGSGTTALVARKHARHAVGIELNAEYCELIAKRTRQLSLLAQ